MAKDRKWSNLEGVLPVYEAGPSPWMKKVLEAVDARRGITMVGLMDEWEELEKADAVAAEAQGQRNILYAAIERRMLEELATVKSVSGGDTWRGNGRTVSPKFTPRPLVKDPHALLRWIKETGQEDLLSLPAPRLKSIVCAAMDESLAELLDADQRAALAPGDPSSGQPPPGVEVYLEKGVHAPTPSKKASASSDAE